MITMVENFLAATVRTATPLLLAGLGALFSSCAGTLNLGMEGFMLTGALAAVLGSYYSGSATVGVFTAILCGMLLAVIFGYFVIHVKANQTVVGIALNQFSIGFTTLVNRVILSGLISVTSVSSFSSIAIPGLARIPILGSTLFNQPALTYFAFFLVPVAWFSYSRTAVGLEIRAVGHIPKACATAGISVNRIRWVTILICGAMAGIAGAFISLAQLSFFTENMVAGRGYMVMAVVTFGNYTPIGVMLTSLLFGASQALEYRFLAAGTGIPYQVSMMVPYVITIIALCTTKRRKSNAPISIGIPYSKE